MKKSGIAIAIALVFAFTGFTFASDQGKTDHSGHGHDMKTEQPKDMDHSGHGHDMKGHAKEMDHSGHMGDLIHESETDGYIFAYHLIDMKEMMKDMKDMKDMPEMKSHHLMLYVVSPKGDVTDAKVGYLVKNPDGTDQKAMCMGMKGGFGADVDFKAKGIYKITTKLLDGDKKVVNEFEYNNVDEE